MGGLFSSGAKNATTITKYTALDVQTSAYGLPIPIGWGQARIAGNLIDAGNFKAIPQRSGGKKGGGGKGGGGGKKASPITSYDYKTAMILALCEGPISAILTVYVNSQIISGFPTGVDGVPDSAFFGYPDQPWCGFLNDQTYAYTAYVCDSNLDLGSTPTLPNYGFEIAFLFSNSEPVFPDANPAVILNDFLTNFQYGIGFGPAVGSTGSFIDGPSWNNYKTYCSAQQLLFSPVLDTQDQILNIINRWAALSNTWIFWSGGLLKFVPLGDQAVTNGQGTTYTPNNNAVFDLGYDDFIFERGQPPVVVSRIDPADAPNTLKMEVRYRGGYYNAFPVEWKDSDLVQKYGQINTPVVQGHDICDPGIGTTSATLIGQRAAYIRNTYMFRLGWEFGILEPGDIVTITEPNIGLSLWPVRIRQLDEDNKGIWSIIAEEFPAGLPTSRAGGTGSAAGVQRPQLGTSPLVINSLADPGNVNAPMIVEPQSSLTAGIPQLWIGASGSSANWGGCNVFIAFDDVNFAFIGTIGSPTRQGVLLAPLPVGSDPDTTNTLQVDLTESFGVLSGNATDADADADRTLCYITDSFVSVAPTAGEFVSYGNSILSSGSYAFDLTYLRRGQFGTAISSFATGSFFTRVDLPVPPVPSPTLITYSLPKQYIGSEVFLKFCSFNIFGAVQQTLDEVNTYPYTPSGAGFGTGSGGVPAQPTGLTATPASLAVVLTWNANTSSDNVTQYQIYKASGLGQSFTAATLVTSAGTSTSYTDAGLPSGSFWTYFLEACNVVGCSTPEGGVDVSIFSTEHDWYQSMSVGGQFTDMVLDEFDNNYEIFDVQAPVPITFPDNFSTSPTPGCETAPLADVTLTFQTITAGVATTVGTCLIPASSTTGTFNDITGFTLAAGDRLRCYAPLGVDSTIAGFFGTVVGTR